MIFFSEDIKNKIVDTTPVDEIIDKLDPNWKDSEEQTKYSGYRYIELLALLD